MLISHEHKFIFIHIPRTGGTSVEKSLGLAMGMTDWKLQNGTPQEHLTQQDLKTPAEAKTAAVRGMKHATALQMRDHVGLDIWNAYRKIAVVRNPLDRTLSVYLKKLKGDQFKMVRPLLRARLAFETALRLKYQVLCKDPDLQSAFLSDRMAR